MPSEAAARAIHGGLTSKVGVAIVNRIIRAKPLLDCRAIRAAPNSWQQQHAATSVWATVRGVLVHVQYKSD